MKAENINTTETVGIKRVATKNIIANKFADKNKKTPARILNEQKKTCEEPNGVLIEDMHRLIGNLRLTYVEQFYAKRIALLPIAEKKVAELSQHCTECSAPDLIKQISIPVSQLMRVVEESQKPILCIDEATANLACMLVFASVQSELTKKHWQDLPNGEELLIQAENHFEELCSGLKIGRRTRAIMNKKKNVTLEVTENMDTEKTKMKLFIGMSGDMFAHIIVFASDENTARKMAEEYIVDKIL